MNTNSIFNSETPPKCDITFLFLNSVSQAINESGFSRAGVIDRMNEALGGEIVVTTDRLNKWLAPGSDRHMPIEYLAAFCWAVRGTLVVDTLLQPIFYRSIDQRGQALQRAAELTLQSQKLKEEADQLLVGVNANSNQTASINPA